MDSDNKDRRIGELGVCEPLRSDSLIANAFATIGDREI